jgi:hypothetical protein
MVHALHDHMFQPVVTTNCCQYGGSTAHAPYRERYDKVIAHVHGAGQVAVSVFELNLGEGQWVQTLLIFAAGSQRTAKSGHSPEHRERSVSLIAVTAGPDHDSVKPTRCGH